MPECERDIQTLETLGIQAYILPDMVFGVLVVMATEDYLLHHCYIDRWFKCVRQVGKQSHFQSRADDPETRV